MKNKFNKKNYLIFTLLLIVLWGCSGKKETTKPEIKNITDAVFASGYVAYSDEYWATANTEGFILNTYIKEGDTVKVLQNLFQLSSDIQLLNTQNAQVNYQDALAKINTNAPQLAQLKSQILQAERTLELDKKNYERYANLIAYKSVSQLEYDTASLQYENSKSNLKILKKSLIELENKLQLQIKNTKNQLEIQKQYVSDYLMKSTTNGVVLEITKNTGELAKKGELLARIGGGKLITKLYIAEEDINKIALNQKTILALNTDTKKTYEAKVSKIYPTFDDKEQSFIIEVSFTNEVPKLFSGTQVQGNIVFEERKNAITIPSKYLTENNTVLLENGEEKTIEIGIYNSEWTEVLTGIDENTTIILPKSN